MLRTTGCFEKTRSCRCQLESSQQTKDIGQDGEHRPNDALVKTQEKSVTRRYEKKYIYHNIITKNKGLIQTKLTYRIILLIFQTKYTI